jgi:hypothetical protein
VEFDSFPARTKPPRRRTFVVVDHDDDSIIVDWLSAHEWAPAILAYAEQLRRGAYHRRVSLRELRPSEMTHGAAPGHPEGMPEGHLHLSLEQPV